jgi:hypothetical protein
VYTFRRQSAGGTPRLRVGASNEQRDGLRRQSMYHLSDRNQIPVTSAKETQRDFEASVEMPLRCHSCTNLRFGFVCLLELPDSKILPSDSRKSGPKFT